MSSIFISLNENQKNQINDLVQLGHYFSFNIKEISKPSFLILIKIFLVNLERISKLNKYKSVKINKNNIQYVMKYLKL